MKRTYHVTLTVEVEPETDLKNFQPGCWCAMLTGTDWKWVEATPEAAIRELLSWAFRGNYDSAHELMPAYTVKPASEEVP